MILLLIVGALVAAPVVFIIGNMVGTALLKARGVGLISFRRTAVPGRWRAPVARLVGPALLYLVAGGVFSLWFYFPENATTYLEVMPDSPAAAAGLRNGDDVSAINGTLVTNFGQIESALRRASPGSRWSWCSSAARSSSPPRPPWTRRGTWACSRGPRCWSTRMARAPSGRW